MPHLAESSGSVYGCCLIQFRINACDGSQIYDGAPAKVLPHAEADISSDPMPGIIQERNGLSAQILDDHIDKAGVGSKQLQRQAVDDDPGEEVRHIGNGLHHSLEFFETKLIQDQCKNNGRRKTDEQVQQVQRQCIPQRVSEIVVAKRLEKVLKAVLLRQRHLPYTLYDAVLLEGDLDIDHRSVLEHDQINDRKRKQRIQLPISFQIALRAGLSDRHEWFLFLNLLSHKPFLLS